MQRQVAGRKALLDRIFQMRCLRLTATVANHIVRVTLERDVRKLPIHPKIERIVEITSVRFKTLENQGFPVAVYISVLSIRLQLPSNIAFLKYRSREHVYSGRSNAALLPIPGEPG